MLIWDFNVSLSLRKVDYLIFFNSAEFEMRQCGKTLSCNLRNVPQVKFRRIHLFEILHSTFLKVHLPNFISCVHWEWVYILCLFRPPTLVTSVKSVNHKVRYMEGLTKTKRKLLRQQQPSDRIICYAKRTLLYFKTVKRSRLCMTSRATGAKTRSADRLISVEQRKLLQ